ncbi:MAG: hypothetical protein CL949_23725 [Erythrobacter sp.]|jgi:hypothetical protein|nr:hypothetical protein [Erythrobacter sp.]|tara:strand:- start:414 stop:1583 length:1170 start_codon:yes stop_codon:yes gene_type:complete
MIENAAAISILDGLATELAEIRRAKEFAQWNGYAAAQARTALANVEPFSAFATTRIFSGDGASALVDVRFGEWAIRQLVRKMEPVEVIAAFEEEVARNSARYEEVSPVIGISVEEKFEISPGIRLVPPASSILDPTSYSYRTQWGPMPEGTGFLVQEYTVTPAYCAEADPDAGSEAKAATHPDRAKRDEVKERLRRVCLLLSPGGVELPVSVILADDRSLFQIDGNSFSRPYAARPQCAQPIDTVELMALYEALGKVADRDVIERAVDRLGRSRLSTDPVDRALDLGMAAEIVLMHDAGGGNAEIAYKISSRAAWLLEPDADRRITIFGLMRDLYTARSKAVHTGKFPDKNAVDLADADQLVCRIVRTIVARGGFPDWKRLALGDMLEG